MYFFRNSGVCLPILPRTAMECHDLDVWSHLRFYRRNLSFKTEQQQLLNEISGAIFSCWLLFHGVLHPSFNICISLPVANPTLLSSNHPSSFQFHSFSISFPSHFYFFFSTVFLRRSRGIGHDVRFKSYPRLSTDTKKELHCHYEISSNLSGPS